MRWISVSSVSVEVGTQSTTLASRRVVTRCVISNTSSRRWESYLTPVRARFEMTRRARRLVVAARLHLPEQGLAKADRGVQVRDVVDEIGANRRLAERVLGNDGVGHRLQRRKHDRRNHGSNEQRQLAEPSRGCACVGLALRLHNRRSGRGHGQGDECDGEVGDQRCAS